MEIQSAFSGNVLHHQSQLPVWKSHLALLLLHLQQCLGSSKGSMIIFQPPALWQDTATHVVLTHPLFSLRSLCLELSGLGQGDLPQGTCPSPLVSTRGLCCSERLLWYCLGYPCTWLQIQIFVIAFTGFTVTLLLGGDHLLQLGLLAFEKEVIPAAIGFNTRKNCCGLRQPGIFPVFRGNMGISLPSPGPKPTEQVSSAAAELTPALSGDVPSGCSASSPSSPLSVPCQSAQGPELVPSHREFCRCCSIAQYLEKRKFQNILFPSSYVTFYVFCHFQGYCALEPIISFLFLLTKADVRLSKNTIYHLNWCLNYCSVCTVASRSLFWIQVFTLIFNATAFKYLSKMH